MGLIISVAIPFYVVIVSLTIKLIFVVIELKNQCSSVIEIHL